MTQTKDHTETLADLSRALATPGPVSRMDLETFARYALHYMQPEQRRTLMRETPGAYFRIVDHFASDATRPR